MTLIKKTIGVRLWTLFKVPMLFFMSPIVKELDHKRASISIGLRYRTKNHFNSMYMGVLVAGADLACGLLALEIIRSREKKLSIIFKDISATFFKRAEARTIFVCDEGKRISQAIDEAIMTAKRQNITVKVSAFCPEKFSDIEVAQFKMTLSVKEIS